MKVTKVFKSIRYSLAGINGIFLLSGFLLLIIGIIVLILYRGYDGFITQRFLQLPSFLIATSVIIFCIAALGFYAAISKNFYFIATYVLLLVAVLIFEIAMCVVGYGLYNDAITEIRTTMQTSIPEYTTKLDVAQMWDDLQMSYECCGVTGVREWGFDTVPVSCCPIPDGTISPFACTWNKVYTNGCAQVLGNWLSYNAYVIGVTALVLTCLQVLIVAAAVWLAWKSRYEEVELES